MKSQEKQEEQIVKLSVTQTQLQDAESDSAPNVVMYELNKLQKDKNVKFEVKK